MKILAVAMRDVAVFGSDELIVQTGDREIEQYEVFRDGRIRTMQEGMTMDDVHAAVEKFGWGYLVDPPVEVGGLGELPRYLGTFSITSEIRCRHAPAK